MQQEKYTAMNEAMEAVNQVKADYEQRLVKLRQDLVQMQMKAENLDHELTEKIQANKEMIEEFQLEE